MLIGVIYQLVLKFLRYLKKCRSVILLKKIFFRKIKFFSTGIPQTTENAEKNMRGVPPPLMNMKHENSDFGRAYNVRGS